MQTNPIETSESLEETAAFICSKLKEHGIDVVLSGGSCMEIYTKSNFSSYDIDFIPSPGVTSKQIDKIMKELGFEKTPPRYYKHTNNPNYIEFPTGPVTLGNDITKEFAKLKTHVGTLTLLTATDCIKDRLCALVYHGGEECYSQAVAVAHLNEINKDNLYEWAKKEDPLMIEKVNILFEDVNVLEKKDITANDIKKYLDTKAKDLYLDINVESDFEELKDDLFEDYVLRQLLKITNNSEYYSILDKFYKEHIE